MPAIIVPDDAEQVVFAANQPQYEPLPAIKFSDGKVLTEWKLSEYERAALIRGETIRIWTFTFNSPFQPIMLEITSENRP